MRKELRANLLILAVTLFAIFLILEASVRTYYLINPRNNFPVYMADEKLGYKMKPNLFINYKTNDFNISWETNNEGYRDSNFSTLDKNITLMLGDSFTVGHGVEEEETFSHILEEYLNQKFYNLGVAGYSQKQHIEQLKDFSERYDVNMAVLNFYMGNDVQENCGVVERELANDGERLISTKKQTYADKIKSIIKKSKAVVLIYEKLVLPLKVNKRYASFYIGELQTDETLRCFNITLNYLSEIKNLSKTNNFELVVFLIPPEDITNRLKADKFRKKYPGTNIYYISEIMMSICDKIEMDCYDLTGSFKEKDSTYFIDNHWSPSGHRLAVEKMRQILKTY